MTHLSARRRPHSTTVLSHTCSSVLLLQQQLVSGVGVMFEREVLEAGSAEAMRQGFELCGAELQAARDRLTEVMPRLVNIFTSLEAGLASQTEELERVRVALTGNADQLGLLTEVRQALDSMVARMLMVGDKSDALVSHIETLVTDGGAIVARVNQLEQLSKRTKFIALNARLDAVRAGPGGRTFRVVADEVKAMADEAAAVTSEVQQSMLTVRATLADLQDSVTLLAGKGFNHVLDKHNAVLAAICRLDASHEVTSDAAAKLRDDVADAVRSLQFEDLLSQLLERTSERFSQLVLLWKAWQLACTRDDETAWQSLTKVLGSFAVPQPPPRLESLQAGTSELFDPKSLSD